MIKMEASTLNSFWLSKQSWKNNQLYKILGTTEKNTNEGWENGSGKDYLCGILHKSCFV